MKLLQIAEAAAAIAGTVLCFLIAPQAGAVMLVTVVVMLAVQLILAYLREKQLHNMCSEIDRVLQGAEQINLSGYEEGALGTLSAELNKVTVKLREQNADIMKEQAFTKEALEDMSHQLRTPLTSAVLLAEQLRRPGTDQRRQMQSIQELVKLLSRMQWLIETMLGVSRLDAGAVMMRPQEIPCSRLISEALEPILITLELRGIDVSVECPPEAAFVCDTAYTAEALLNILKNCMEHTPEGGRISVQAENNGIFTRFVITDSGEGIPESALPHLFERFYRNEQAYHAGYGIGLNFAMKIIRAQDGTLAARNVPAGGAQFEIRFYKTVV